MYKEAALTEMYSSDKLKELLIRVDALDGWWIEF
jgi:hypothetical protein